MKKSFHFSLNAGFFFIESEFFGLTGHERSNKKYWFD